MSPRRERARAARVAVAMVAGLAGLAGLAGCRSEAETFRLHLTWEQSDAQRCPAGPGGLATCSSIPMRLAAMGWPDRSAMNSSQFSGIVADIRRKKSRVR